MKLSPTLSPVIGQAGKRHVTSLLSRLPRPDRQASAAISAWARQQNLDLDPDQVLAVTLHYTVDKERGWLAKVAEQMTMTQALLTNWQDRSEALTLQQLAMQALSPARTLDLLGLLPALILPHGRQPWPAALATGQFTLVEALPKGGLFEDIDDYSVYHGLFRRNEPMRYDASTCVPVKAEAFQSFIWQFEFQDVFKRQLEDFWQHSLEHYAQCSRAAFLAACNKQTRHSSLSERARSLAWRAAGVERTSTQRQLSANGVEARLLNINGCMSSDILCLRDTSSGVTLLYMPGNASPIHEFVNLRHLNFWLAHQCTDPAKRAALLGHFQYRDIPDRLTRSGLATVLTGFADYPPKHWILPATRVVRLVRYWNPHSVINYRPDTYSPRIDGDLFMACALQQQRRSQADAEFLITRDSEVSQATWRGYFYLCMNLLTPFLLVVPELIPLVMVAGATQFGVGLDEALNGKSQQQQEEGTWQTVFGLLNAAPGLAQGVKASKALLGSRPLGWVKPVRINARVGYPLSPVMPPHLPEAVMPLFNELAEAGEDIAVARPGGDPLVANSVVRRRGFNGDDVLSGKIADRPHRLYYDAGSDSFVIRYPNGARGTQHFIADPATPGSLIADTDPAREISNASRTRTLRALGLDLTLPVDLEALGRTAGLPLPKQIFSLWVGDQVIAGDYMQALDNNLRVLQGSEYRLTLYLSDASPHAYAQNRDQLASRMQAGLQVSTLETQSFYRQFSQSPYFGQYQAAIEGNGGVASNFSSASDILRYRILRSEGGIYLDMDDHLLSEGAQAKIDSVALNTQLDGLLLRSPVCNAQLGMHTSYNTSMIGSRALNPLLDEISDEILSRYLTAEGRAFYTEPKPSRLDSAAYLTYTRKLHQLTGPAVLNHVIDQYLPDLYTYRQVADLVSLQPLSHEALFDEAALLRAEQRLLPLEHVAQAGNAQGY
ncbi:dermonecrotic toxin domain-containing protein [Pseudomonas sp. JR33AA]|uniref:dermonecrotic toxin domain-containing protein n=1 Tax=Pseudomonas sp. JR33AA TaxID=2899113 RepID=UPI001F3E6701|nr:DUF6543 domain-containing protein [Pseudomonas sp. JR33AA]MCE5980040.1 mannosyltransferase [Pseudomonas sp. JR33AA]